MQDRVLFQSMRNVTDTNLRNYEISDEKNKYYERTKGMGIEKLVGLADFYGVSTDYLLGRDVPSDPSMKGTCEFTGLSENTVKSILNLEKGDNLDYYKDSNYVPQYIKILNTLYEMGLIANIVQAFSRFLCRDRKDRDLNSIWIGSEKEYEEAKELTGWLLHKDITNAVDDVIDKLANA